MKKWYPVVLLAMAQFIMVLDSTVMNVSISQVVADLGTTVAGLQAAITFYTLTMAAFMLTGGKIGDALGRVRTFRIGAVIYAIGSLVTALSPNIAVLMFGWSLVEGLGAVLVIPAIAALVAAEYKGRDRVLAYAIVGAIAGAAAALGPLIGGFVTTYFSWRYVFVAEVVIMIGVLFGSKILKQTKKTTAKVKIDLPSVALSASGLGLVVFGLLQSKVWGWIVPMTKPEVAGHEIAPFGISIVAYLIVIGVVVLWNFAQRQKKLEDNGKEPLLRMSLLKIPQLRAGLGVLMAQYAVIAAVFFTLPVYLQMVLGLDALQTGVRILPLSIALVLFSIAGSKMVTKYTPKQVVRLGQILLVAGALLITAAIDPQLKSIAFFIGMFVVGSGLGLLASQLGNINMSAVPVQQSSEVGGLQGTFQNLGSSFGTALIGSLMIMALTSGFVSNISASTLPVEIKNYVQQNTTAGVAIVPASDVQGYALDQGLSEAEATEISDSYKDAQVTSLKSSMFFVSVIALCALPLSRNIPDKRMVR
ncbi:MFS transporter [Candidatus Saccharibacteria bacterium]|nr:MFS transporter [Candidatus Saccharibacteria bacterium]